MDAWGSQAAVFVDEIRRVAGEVAGLKKYCEGLEAEIKDLKRRLQIHENHNNPDRGTLTAKKRKEHRKEIKKKKAAKVEAAGGDPSTILKKRGGQLGSKGVSLVLKPDKSLEEWHVADTCAVCGRTDVIPLRPVWKVVIEMYEAWGKADCSAIWRSL